MSTLKPGRRKKQPNKNHPDINRKFVEQETGQFLKQGGRIEYIEKVPPMADLTGLGFSFGGADALLMGN